jgi:hypothetical protein
MSNERAEKIRKERAIDTVEKAQAAATQGRLAEQAAAEQTAKDLQDATAKSLPASREGTPALPAGKDEDENAADKMEVVDENKPEDEVPEEEAEKPEDGAQAPQHEQPHEMLENSSFCDDQGRPYRTPATPTSTRDPP